MRKMEGTAMFGAAKLCGCDDDAGTTWGKVTMQKSTSYHLQHLGLNIFNLKTICSSMLLYKQ